MEPNLSRRRFLSLSAGVTAMGLMPLPVFATSPLLRHWTGSALGGPASIAIHYPDRAAADRLIGRCVAEIGRLEGIFSLYRPDSALSRLNRNGHLAAPPSDLVVLLSESIRFSRLTGGAFDVTVQPLWRLYTDHFSRTGASADGPDRDAVERALALVGYDGVRIDADRIAFARPGMAVTLNGIAQGFITDRIATFLRSGGCDSVLADLGEIRALGTHPNGQAWRIGLADPWMPDQIARTLEITDRAVATSAATGFQFDRSGRFHHLLDPATGSSAGRYASVSVVARDATAADALSTALTLMPIAEAERVLNAERSPMALFTHPDGGTQICKGAFS
jgi:FAD:protein FMN transferase